MLPGRGDRSGDRIDIGSHGGTVPLPAHHRHASSGPAIVRAHAPAAADQAAWQSHGQTRARGL